MKNTSHILLLKNLRKITVHFGKVGSLIGGETLQPRSYIMANILKSSRSKVTTLWGALLNPYHIFLIIRDASLDVGG
jgi:hypothetical protein